MSTITITNIKKSGTAYSVTTDQEEESELKLHPEIVSIYNIRANKILSQSEWHEIIKENDYKFCYKKALDLLTRRLHSEHELKTKLKNKHFEYKTIDNVINVCKELAFIDDQRFAEIYFTELQAKGYGPSRIRQQFFKKYIPKDIIDKILRENSNAENDLAMLTQLAERKSKSLSREKDPRKKREKLFRHLVSKGFSFDLINQALDSLSNEI